MRVYPHVFGAELSHLRLEAGRLSDTHTYTHTLVHIHSLSLPLSLTHTLSLSLSLSRTHTHSHTHTHTHTRTHSLSRTHSFSLTHTDRHVFGAELSHLRLEARCLPEFLSNQGHLIRQRLKSPESWLEMSLAPAVDSASSQEARRAPPARNSARPRGGLSRLLFRASGFGDEGSGVGRTAMCSARS